MHELCPMSGSLKTATLVVFLLFPAWLPAQQSDPEGTSRGIAIVPEPGEEQRDDETSSEFDRSPVLPPGNLPWQSDQLSGVAGVRVESITLPNNTVLTEQQIAEVTKPYTSRVVTTEELSALRHKLSMLYFDLGYVNSGVILPDQKVSDGTIEFTEVLGSLTDVQLEGNHVLNDNYWLSRINKATSGPLQINELQSTLQIIEQHPLVQRIEAQLVPGLVAGESSLHLNVFETSPWRLIIGADNHRSPSLGGEQLTLYLAHLSLTGRGDVVEIYANLADGLGDGGLSYTLPLRSRGSTIKGWFSGGDADIVEYPFNQLNIQSKTYNLGAEFSYPFMKATNYAWLGLLGVEAKHSESTLLDTPFSFSLGEIEGEADTTALILGTEWTHRSQQQVFAFRMTFHLGTDWWNAAVNPDVPSGLNGPSTDFITAQGQFQYVRRLSWHDSELHVRSAFQFANDPLLPVEKMPVGGVNSVRGYRENLLVRDNGLVASAEWRLPLFRKHTPAENFNWRALTVAAFTDFGMSWDQDSGLPSDEKEKIYSVGLGLIWSPLPGLTAQVYRGEALQDVIGSGDDLQDDGWHWRLSYQVF